MQRFEELELARIVARQSADAGGTVWKELAQVELARALAASQASPRSSRSERACNSSSIRRMTFGEASSARTTCGRQRSRVEAGTAKGADGAVERARVAPVFLERKRASKLGRLGTCDSSGALARRRVGDQATPHQPGRPAIAASSTRRSFRTMSTSDA